MTAIVDKKTTLIADAWTQFEASVLAPDAPDIQRSEMKIAFYGGANCTLQLLRQLGESDVSEDGGVEVLTGCMDECQAFITDVISKIEKQ